MGPSSRLPHRPRGGRKYYRGVLLAPFQGVFNTVIFQSCSLYTSPALDVSTYIYVLLITVQCFATHVLVSVLQSVSVFGFFTCRCD